MGEGKELTGSKIIEQGAEKFDSGYDHKQAIMKEASRQLNHDEIQGKVMSMPPEKLASQQSSKIKSLISSDPKKLEKMKYYDSDLNLERKCNHFQTLFLKLRLKVIHKPFIILDMLKILDDNRSPFDIFMCLYVRLRNTQKRKGFDAILRFVEHKNELAETWVYLAEKLLERNKRDFIKQVKARKKVEKQEVDKSKIMKRSLTFLFSVMGNFVRRNLRKGFADIKGRAEEEKKKMKEEEEKGRKQLDIAAQQNFFVHKVEKKPVEPEVKIVEVEVEVPVPVKADPVSFEVENTNNLFHHVPERRGQMNAYLESKTHVNVEEEPEKDSHISEKSEDKQQQRMLAEINQHIKSIKEQLVSKSLGEMLTLDEEIALLNQLTKLLGLLRSYYEYIMDNPKFRDSKNTRRNFEQIMELTKNIIDKLVGRVESENRKRREEDLEKEETEEAKRKRHSLLHIDNLNRNLKKELEELENFLDPREEGETHESTGSQGFPEQNEMNDLLQQMVQNLAQMNNKMDSFQNVVEEEEEETEEEPPESKSKDNRSCLRKDFLRKKEELESRKKGKGRPVQLLRSTQLQNQKVQPKSPARSLLAAEREVPRRVLPPPPEEHRPVRLERLRDSATREVEYRSQPPQQHPQPNRLQNEQVPQRETQRSAEDPFGSFAVQGCSSLQKRPSLLFW